MINKQDYSLDTYQELVRLGAIRWLHAIDLNISSHTHGIADREFWSWKIKDFANATWQGGIAGFLDATPLLALRDEQVVKIIHACIIGTQRIQRNNGSFEEAYPYESSVCVTGLVAFNLCYAYLKYPHFFKNDTVSILRSIISKTYQFLLTASETHGIIANHIATCALAQLLSRHLLNLEINDREIKSLITLQDSQEMWFPEYGGADPGYQTLLNHYLLAGMSLVQVPQLVEILQKSVHFISHFCFPNGSFSGEIGSRGTAIFYPSGSLIIENESIHDSSLTHWFLEQHLHKMECITPINADSGNFVPVFNSWAFGFGMLKNSKFRKNINFQMPNAYFKWFKNANLIVGRNESAMIAISTNSGCIRKVVKDNNEKWQDESLIGYTSTNLTTQGSKPDNIKFDHNILSWNYCCRKKKQNLNNPIYSSVLRIVSFLIYRFPRLQLALKWSLAKFLMSSKDCRHTPINIYIDFNSSNYAIKVEEIQEWQKITAGFQSHMASANTFDLRYL